MRLSIARLFYACKFLLCYLLTLMHLSITSDFVDSHDEPGPHLHAIRAAGFTEVHWCHEWDTDFLYSGARIAEIRNELVDLGLRVNNLHASEGKEASWGSSERMARNAGVELVKNRLEMAAELGASCIILHASSRFEIDSQRESLSEIIGLSEQSGVRVALENLPRDGFSRVFDLLDEHDTPQLGYCFDTGHALLNNALGFDDLSDARRRIDRLYALHLHDNDGSGDLHRLPFHGVVSWQEVCRLIADSPYSGSLTLEVVLAHESFADRSEFLSAAREAGMKIDRMVADLTQ